MMLLEVAHDQAQHVVQLLDGVHRRHHLLGAPDLGQPLSRMQGRRTDRNGVQEAVRHVHRHTFFRIDFIEKEVIEFVELVFGQRGEGSRHCLNLRYGRGPDSPSLREWFRGFVRDHRGRPLTDPALDNLELLNRLLSRDEATFR